MINVIWQAFICLALVALICDASNFTTSQYVVWCSDNKFDHQESSYGSNLKSLLSFLSTNATKYNGYYATNTTAIYGASKGETIYGMFECRGDTTPNDCASCVSNAIRQLPPKECPSDKGVMIWHNKCNIRYSNEEFLGHLEEDVHISLTNNKSISTLDNDVEGFMKLVSDTLHCSSHQLRSISSNQPISSSMEEGSRKYFKTNKTKVNNIVRLYTMVQCTPTLVPADCGSCIGILINEMLVSCNGCRGGRILNPSCYARFEVYPFYNIVASSSQSQFSLAKGSDDKSRNKLLIASVLSTLPISATIWLLVLFAIRIFRRKTTKETCDDEIDEIRSTLDSLQYDFNTIKTATCNFSLDNKIGKGGFGEVFKGKLKNGQEIAIKRLTKDTGQGIEQFKTEVVLVAKLQHKNLVKLLGFCVSSKEKMLVFEFLPNSSLDRFLFGSSKKANLDWQTRFKIIVGIARGLLYLHEDSRLKVVHRDLKTSNILLDEDMNPKISDFGLAKHFGVNEFQGDTQRIAGTYGYMAPEYALTGRYSSKSDIYSFGVIILEIVSGRKNSFFGALEFEEELLPYAWRLWNQEKALDLVDAALNDDFPKEEVQKCIHIGLLCIQEHANERPEMTSIVAALNGQAINFPMPKPPCFIGSFTKVKDSKTLHQSGSFSEYTGFESITHLLPRD